MYKLLQPATVLSAGRPLFAERNLHRIQDSKRPCAMQHTNRETKDGESVHARMKKSAEARRSGQCLGRCHRGRILLACVIRAPDGCGMTILDAAALRPLRRTPATLRTLAK